MNEKKIFPQDAITDFHDPRYSFLSNFYAADVLYEGLIYKNNEAAFQAQKCLSLEEKQNFVNLPPNKSKALGRKVRLRPDWEEVKFGIMEEIVRAKFFQHPELAVKLVSTGDRPLIEGNLWGDTCWGIDARSGKGENNLGKILMKIRNELK